MNSDIMTFFEQNKTFFNQPIRLTESEREKPLKFIADYFESEIHLFEVRADLWRLVLIAITSDDEELDGEFRSNILWFYERLETLIEAAYILSQKGVEKKVEKDKKTKGK